ncbi:MAG: hypothetical protein M1825_005559 [Sarcosagium campestre]|nr:MAG: hypothetical protein M1825_005559 [Sarcosagium campestre]
MAGRHPYNSGDGHYPPRDRSPPDRSHDRRPSPPYTSDPRRLDPARRASNDTGGAPAGGLSNRDGPLRDAPRGPKGSVEPRGSAPGSSPYAPIGPRGRISISRNDPRDRDRDLRDSRDTRDSLFSRQDRGADRPRRERDFDRDRRHSPPPRGRSPLTREPREPREKLRDLDFDRARRAARDGPLSAGSSSSDPSGVPPPGRGGFARGRGRADWDFRARGRAGPYGDDRERLRTRSRSRERRWERDSDRERERDSERPLGRRIDDRKPIGREDRDREIERYKRERGGASGSATTPSTPHPLSATSPAASSDGRFPPESARRASSGTVLSSGRDGRRDGDKADYLNARGDGFRDRHPIRTASPPPQAPQVPAFGSVSYRPAAAAAAQASNVWRATSPSKQVGERASQQAAKLTPPTGPKALTAQPPTAPRADRAIGKTPAFSGRDAEPARGQEMAPQSGSTSASQPARPASSAYHGTSASELSAVKSRTSPAAAASQPPPTTRPLSSSSNQAFGRGLAAPTDVPTGPGAASFGARPTSSSRSGARDAAVDPPPPPGPATLGANVPTGPRLGRSTRGKSYQWTRGGGHVNQSPGRLGVVPAKRDFKGDERDRASREGSASEPGRSSGLAMGAAEPTAAARRDNLDRAKGDVQMSDAPQSPDQLVAPIGSYRIDDMEDDDEDEIDMDETFNEFEHRINQDMARLQERLDVASTNLERALDFLEEVDLAITHDSQDPPAPEPQSRKPSVPRQINAMPTPKDDEDVGSSELTEDDIALRDVARNRMPTPLIEELPFLNSGPPTPVSDLEAPSQAKEQVKEHIAGHIMFQRQRNKRANDKLRQTYAELYIQWRANVERLDSQARLTAEKAPDTAAPAPEPAAAAVAQPTTTTEGRRGGKFSTELEFQRILKETELAAKEQQEQADREAKAKSDTAKEATIPDMFDDIQRQTCIFKDANQILNGRLALATFNFVPPEDDFTAEEQDIFIQNFIAFPKKWGKIADALPDRDYKQCILHYYLTKDEVKYKDKANKSKKKKGRRAGITASSRPKSNALMSDLGVHPDLYEGDEFEAAPAVPVTESGRPKRAAAPVFGEATTDNDSGTAASTPGRRPAATPKSDANSENPMERTGKRGKTGLTRDRGRGRGKSSTQTSVHSQQQQQQQQSSRMEKSREKEAKEGGKKHEQLGKDMNRSVDRGQPQPAEAVEPITRSGPPESSSMAMNLDGAPEPPRQAPRQSVAPPQSQPQHLPQPQPQRSPQQQHSPQQPLLVVQAPQNVPPSSAPIQSRENGRQGRSQKPASTTSSYWSVPETSDFPKLLDHFGTDWQAIALHMSSKTSIMVKNFYKRGVKESGQNDWRERAERADARKAQGELMGPPPTTSTLPKRRYETPQPSMHRQLAPNEPIEIEDDSPRSHNAAPPHASPPPSQQPQQPQQHATAGPRFAPLAQAASTPQQAHAQQHALQAASMMPARTMIAPNSQQAESRPAQQPPGPRAGYFTDARTESRPILQAHPGPPAAGPPPAGHPGSQISSIQHRPEYHGHVNPQQHQAKQQQMQGRYSIQPQPQPQPQVPTPVAASHASHEHAPSSNVPLQPRVSSNPQGDPRSQAAFVAHQQQHVVPAAHHPTQSQHQHLHPHSQPHSQPQPQAQSQPQPLPHQMQPRGQPPQQQQAPPRHSSGGHGQAQGPGQGKFLKQPEQIPVAHGGARSPAGYVDPAYQRAADSRFAAPAPPPPAAPSSASAARPQEATRKTSNIMALLNSNEPEEPRPRNRAEPVPSAASAPPPSYHGATAGQPSPGYRPDSGHHEVHGSRDPYQRPASRSSAWYPGPGYPQPTSSSPGPQQASYSQGPPPPPQPQPQPQPSSQASRQSYPPLHSHSPPPQYVHSRGSSYSDRHAPPLPPQHQRSQQNTPPPGHVYAEPPRPQYPHQQAGPTPPPSQHPHHRPHESPHHQHHHQHGQSLQGMRGQPPGPGQQPPPPTHQQQQVLHPYAPHPGHVGQAQAAPPPPPPQPHDAPNGQPPRTYTPGPYHHQPVRGYEPPPRGYEGRDRR